MRNRRSDRASRPSPVVRHGYTVVELLLVLAIVGIVLSIAVPRGKLALDRITVRSAASDVASVLSFARSFAIASRASVAIDVTADGVLRVRRRDELLLVRNIASTHAVRVQRTRDSLTYGPLGMGRGAANLSIIVTRGAAADTVFVSRLGRVR